MTDARTIAEGLSRAEAFVRDVLENIFHQTTTDAQVRDVALDILRTQYGRREVVAMLAAATPSQPHDPLQHNPSSKASGDG